MRAAKLKWTRQALKSIGHGVGLSGSVCLQAKISEWLEHGRISVCTNGYAALSVSPVCVQLMVLLLNLPVSVVTWCGSVRSCESCSKHYFLSKMKANVCFFSCLTSVACIWNGSHEVFKSEADLSRHSVIYNGLVLKLIYYIGFMIVVNIWHKHI